ncbi:MAG: DUF4105 domain-containing protein [Muribaculaceae bacterium]|nr:DUF4105 domain-containing protein [Muribaculaceae bacterium]
MRVSFLTCGPGANVYELCGHAAIRISNGNNGVDDYVVNYGLFDFDSPNFLYRFVTGQTDYKVGAQPTNYFLQSYYRHGRSVNEYELNLTETQKQELERLLWINLQPENSSYRYNYVKDNCATRPLEIIERAIGDSITFDYEPSSTAGWSFRDEMKWYHRNYPWYQLGIDMALGSGIDYKLTTREKAFAPLMLDSLLLHATIPDSLGLSQPLVKRFNVLIPEMNGGPTAGPTPWYLTPMFIFWALFIIILIISCKNILKHTESRWLDTVIYSIYGLAGCVIAFLILCSEHEATSPNWIVVALNPFCFIAAILPWIKKLGKILYYYHTANFFILLILGCTWFLTGQIFNMAVIPLLLIDMLRSDTYRIIWKCKKANIHTIHQK